MVCLLRLVLSSMSLFPTYFHENNFEEITNGVNRYSNGHFLVWSEISTRKVRKIGVLNIGNGVNYGLCLLKRENMRV